MGWFSRSRSRPALVEEYRRPPPTPEPIPAPALPADQPFGAAGLGPPAFAPPSPPAAPVTSGRRVELDAVLDEVSRVLADVRGAVFATRDGLCVASTIPEPQAGTVAAMAAAVLSLSESALDFGEAPTGRPDPLRSTVLRGSDGCLAVVPAGALGALAVKTGAKPNIGLLGVELPRAAAKLAGVATGAGA